MNFEDCIRQVFTILALTSMRLPVSFHLKFYNLSEIQKNFTDAHLLHLLSQSWDVTGEGEDREEHITSNLHLQTISNKVDYNKTLK